MWGYLSSQHVTDQWDTNKDLTSRVKCGAYYTDGETLVQVLHVYPLGAIKVQCVRTGYTSVWVISAFRKTFWLVSRGEP